MDNYWAAARSKSEVDKMVIDQGSGAYLVRLVKVRMPLCITFFNFKKKNTVPVSPYLNVLPCCTVVLVVSEQPIIKDQRSELMLHRLLFSNRGVWRCWQDVLTAQH